MSAQRAYSAPLAVHHGAHPSASLTVAKPARALHIPAEVLAHPGLSLLACAVLAEVLDLHRAKGHVFASDEHFAERCRAKPRTVRETIAELEAAGFLTREVNYAARHKRRLTPTDLWRNPPLLVAESATSPIEVVADSATSSGEIRRELWRNPPGVVADSANINTSLNTSTNTNLNTLSPAADAAARGQKKIEDENSEYQGITGSQEDVTRTLPTTKTADAELVTAAKSAAPAKKRAAGRAAAPARAAELLPDSCPLAELLNPGGDAARVQLLAEPLTEKQAGALLNEFSEPVLRDIFCQMANWGKLLAPAGATSANLTARNWLNKRADARKTEQNGAVQHLAGRPGGMSGGFHRSTNGAKPTADAGAFARAIAEDQWE